MASSVWNATLRVTFMHYFFLYRVIVQIVSIPNTFFWIRYAVKIELEVVVII